MASKTVPMALTSDEMFLLYWIRHAAATLALKMKDAPQIDRPRVLAAAIDSLDVVLAVRRIDDKEFADLAERNIRTEARRLSRLPRARLVERIRTVAVLAEMATKAAA